MYNSNDSNKAYDAFVEKFSQSYDSCFPLKRSNRKTKIFLEKPWILYALQKSIRKKNKLYKRFLNKPTLNNNTKCKSYKEQIDTVITNC